MRVLGFDDFVPSADGQSTAERPLGGILFMADSEQMQRQRRLVKYIEKRFVHFIEPEQDRLH